MSWESSTIEYIKTDLALQGFIPSAIFIILCYAVFLNARAAPWGLALLVFPGTVAHELAHLAMGLILGARPRNVSLWPQRTAQGWRLGEVGFRRIGILNGAFVSLAPIVLFPLGWLCFIHVMVPAWLMRQWLVWSVVGYLAATLFYASIPSLTDLRAGARSLIVYSTLGIALWAVAPMLHGWFSGG